MCAVSQFHAWLYYRRRAQSKQTQGEGGGQQERYGRPINMYQVIARSDLLRVHPAPHTNPCPSFSRYILSKFRRTPDLGVYGACCVCNATTVHSPPKTNQSACWHTCILYTKSVTHSGPHLSWNVLSGRTPKGKPVFSDSATCGTGDASTPSPPSAPPLATAEGPPRGRPARGFRPVPSSEGWLSRLEYVLTIVSQSHRSFWWNNIQCARRARSGGTCAGFFLR